MRDPISGKQRNETAIACMQRDALRQIHKILAPLLRAAPIIFSYRATTCAARQSHTMHMTWQLPRNIHLRCATARITLTKAAIIAAGVGFMPAP
ncbi:hypothetical protein [Cupriavidus oxalaticus]|uniref:hypothetical protein n=1 Tax=Cupriavidus oxalaticus TaxID=96344 RepID=UPI001244D5B7|nr:hypothetical protein [Cupriavidus oxalaticus]